MPSSITDIDPNVIGYNVQEICNKLSTLASEAKADINSGVTGYTGPTGATGPTLQVSAPSGVTAATNCTTIIFGTGLSGSFTGGVLRVWIP